MFCGTLLVRAQLPEVVSVLLTQTANATAAYLCWQGSRAYVGRSTGPHIRALVVLAGVLGLAVYFTVADPQPGVRFALTGTVAGACFLATARTVAQGGFREAPARYLFAGMVTLHGSFVLARPLLFRLAAPSDEGLLLQISQFVLLEATVALVMIAFGTLMLINEYVTTELRHLAEVDALTSVFNRRAFLALLDKGLTGAKQAGEALPVLVVDLDHFKKINDTWGHRSGDDALRHFVVLAQRCLRKQDVMGRLGGEEFAIFLPGSDRSGAAAVAERLRALVETQPPAGAGGATPLTVSIGIALAGAGDSAQSVLQRADEAMYMAKKRGRNRVEMLPAPDCGMPAVAAS